MTITLDLTRTIAPIDRNVFGGFAEHLGRCIYGGMYDPDSPQADENGFRKDVLDALRRLNMPVIRYPGGNFVSGYRWRDGVGPRDQRPARPELAWHTVETNQFGTDEFVQWCRKLGTEPYLAVNCGDGDMREARDWVEYCNSTQDTALVNMRRQNGFAEPHNVKYWGIGNEIDGPWQMGMKTPEEYARAFTEFGKVMKWVDPSIKLFASATSLWKNFVEYAQLLIEQAPELIDYMAIHWYVGNHNDNFEEYMALSEFFEERLSAYEGLIRALRLDNRIERDIPIAVDEWNVWYRAHQPEMLEEIYNLEDALVVAMHFNAFFRHAHSVKMANIAQVVNVIAPVFTRPDGLFLQTIFHPFELYSQYAGSTALDPHWTGDTFGGGLRVLDVSATLEGNRVAVFVVNRSRTEAQETEIRLVDGRIGGTVDVSVVNGPDVKAVNSFDAPDTVTRRDSTLSADGGRFTVTFEPHSVTALRFDGMM